ncbi:MAG: YraN family protein, partial [Deltaproteobacteria bacterium]|nr:YraN family protein [Deltaproteobacteria bacterium]
MFRFPGPGEATPLNSKSAKNEKIEQNEAGTENNPENNGSGNTSSSPADPHTDPRPDPHTDFHTDFHTDKAPPARHPGNPRSRSTSSPRIRARRALGAEGEKRAASFLLRRGYRIDARNVRYDGVEIDLIARR